VNLDQTLLLKVAKRTDYQIQGIKSDLYSYREIDRSKPYGFRTLETESFASKIH